jgi:hypothetical protein
MWEPSVAMTVWFAGGGGAVRQLSMAPVGAASRKEVLLRVTLSASESASAPFLFNFAGHDAYLPGHFVHIQRHTIPPSIIIV